MDALCRMSTAEAHARARASTSAVRAGYRVIQVLAARAGVKIDTAFIEQTEETLKAWERASESMLLLSAAWTEIGIVAGLPMNGTKKEEIH